ncbi:MAG: hypothetical protein RLZZ117_2284 [Cyanobacteriota bacterium]
MVEPSTTRATASATTRSPSADTSRKGRHDSEHAAMARADGPARATLQRLQALADASPQVAQLQRLQAMADGARQGLLQRKTPEEEEPLQGRFRATQRKTPEEEPLLQGQFTAGGGSISQRQPTPGGAPAPTNRTGLPDGLKSGIEALSGLAMDHVRVHYNSAKPAQLNAHAYAQGNDIHVAPGQEQHLPHEAWHLVQQAQGRVQPTLQLQEGIAVNDDPGLEREADQMGAQALASGH